MAESNSVLHLRVALTTDQYASLVDFFCAGLGVSPSEAWTHDDGHGILLEMGGGTLEIFDDAYGRYVDSVEVGQPVGAAVRLALQVPDVASAVERLLKHGGKLVHAPTLTPWGDMNARVESPDGMQVTLFEANESV